MYNKYIDIFAGCGGLSLGLHSSGWQGLFAVEKNPDAFATLKHNLIDKKNHFEWVDWLSEENHDINEVIKNYKKELKTLSGKVSLVVGGPPCQGFSMAGQRNKNDIRNTLVESYVKFVDIVKPEFIFFENVHGITVGFLDENKNKSIPASDYIVKNLKKMGYNVEAKIIDMYNYGVPQKRKRFILVGALHKDPKVFFILLESRSADFLKSKKLPLRSTVSEAIGDLLASNKQVACIDSNGFKAGAYGASITDYQKFVRMGTNDKVAPNSHRFAKHKAGSVKLFKKMLAECEKGKRLSPKNTTLDGFKKRGVTILEANQPCNTITSHPDDYLHYSEPRIMSVRECARIQSFPDWYEFKGKYTTGGTLRKTDVPRYTQVGNAIPPLFAEQVGLVLKELISNNRYGEFKL